MSDFNIVTTFDTKCVWAPDMVTSCDNYLPSNCSITVYTGNESYQQGRVTYLPEDSERVEKFHRNFQPLKDERIPIGIVPHTRLYNEKLYYFWDAGRFCYKIFAMEHAARNQSSRYLVWIDADVLFNAPPPEDWFDQLVEEGCYTSYLHRRTRHAETGFIIFDTHHPYHHEWWNKVSDIYDNILFKEIREGWTDSHVHDYMVKISERVGVKHKRLSDNADHAWNESPLSTYSTHYKGLRRQGEHGANKF